VTNNYKPEIRFPRFTGDWELCKLKDISKISDGTHQTPKYKDSGIKFVSVEDINDIEASNKYISIEDYETQFKNKPEVGDIFMTRITAGVIGATALIESDNPIAYYVSLALIKPSKKNSSLFLNSYISTKSFKKELNKRIIHTAFPKKINLSDIGECSVSKPSKEEQLKIGNFFKQLDEAISLHQQGLITLKQTKQGFLQKMFPKEGQSMPEIRFPGYTGDWKQCKLGDITESYSGGTPSVGKKSYYGGRIPFIRSAEINSDSTELFITEEGLNNSSAKLVNTGDILYALYGATSGEVGISKIRGAINQAILVIKPTLDDDSYFIAQWLKKQKSKIINTYLQGGQGNLSGSIMKDLSLLLPRDKREQKQISNFLKQLDDTIALHQRELDVLQETKKAFLQKMFV
jgi:type I restriction enzyme S subunit